MSNIFIILMEAPESEDICSTFTENTNTNENILNIVMFWDILLWVTQKQ